MQKKTKKYIAKVAAKNGFRYFYNKSEYASYRAKRKRTSNSPVQKARDDMTKKYVRLLLSRKKKDSTPHTAGSF